MNVGRRKVGIGKAPALGDATMLFFTSFMPGSACLPEWAAREQWFPRKFDVMREMELRMSAFGSRWSGGARGSLLSRVLTALEFVLKESGRRPPGVAFCRKSARVRPQ